jgi:hypothetical protein
MGIEKEVVDEPAVAPSAEHALTGGVGGFCVGGGVGAEGLPPPQAVRHVATRETIGRLRMLIRDPHPGPGPGTDCTSYEVARLRAGR